MKIKKFKDSASRWVVCDNGKDILHQLQDMQYSSYYFCLLSSEENEDALLHVYSLEEDVGVGFCIYTDQNYDYDDFSVQTPEEAADIIKKLYKLQAFH